MKRISHCEATGLASQTPAHRVVPAPQNHVAHFYSSDTVLLSEVAQRLGSSLAAGGAAVAIATAAHCRGLEQQLRLSGFDLTLLAGRGRWLALDATDALEIFMVEGWPDEGLFKAFLGPVLDRLASAASPLLPSGEIPVSGYGEMVSVLWEGGKEGAAIRLEQLWNDLGNSRRFHLSCGWPLRFFSRESDSVAISQICAEHTHILPSPTGGTWGDDRHGQHGLLWHLKAQATLQRASHIARQALGFYREAPAPAWISVQAAVDDVLAIENYRLRERRISVVARIQPGLKIFCVPGDFKRILSNMISDAAEASLQGFSIALRAWNSHQPGGKTAGIRLTVAHRRMDPLSRFASRRMHRSAPAEERPEAGLGIATIREVVRRSGGSVQCRALGDDIHDFRSGTVIMLFLPSGHEAADQQPNRTFDHRNGAAA